MMKTSVFLLSSAAAFVLTAAPVVREQSVTIARVGQSSTWCISYVLDNDPGVVTLDVLTNGVTIGAANFANVKGDVGHLVQPGPRTIMWKAHKSWPGHKVSDLSVRVTAWAANCPPPYLVLSLDSATPPVYYADTNSIPNWGENENRLFKTEKLVLKRIPAAGRCWRMGAGLGDPGASSTTREIPHEVTLTKDYYLAIYPTTQGQHKRVTGSTGTTTFIGYDDFDWQPLGGIPYNYLRGTSPAIDWPTTGTNVADRSSIDFFRKATGCDTLDLPTDAEWEFACRGGVEVFQLYTGKDLSDTTTSPELDAIAWYKSNSSDAGTVRPHEVGRKDPNAYGLYDMLGNVQEACLDWDNGSLPNSDGSRVVDPVGPASYVDASRRIYRGGAYDSPASACCAAARLRASTSEAWTANYGYRLKCAAVAK